MSKRPVNPRSLNIINVGFRPSAIEIVAVVIVVALIAGVIYYYNSSLRPAQSKLNEAQARRTAQLALLTGPTGSDGGPSPAAQIQITKDSLEQFKSEWLKPVEAGRIAIFKEVNSLAAKNGVQLNSGIEMGEGGESGGRRQDSRGKDGEELLNAFPRKRVAFTVVGGYENLRSMMRDLERIKQLVVIDSVELATIEERRSESAARRRVAIPAGQAISLAIGMTAYFRP